MSNPTVYVARKIPAVGLEVLREHCTIRLHAGSLPPQREQLLTGVQGCQGILSLLSDRIDAEVLDAAGPGLKVVSNFAVGFNNIDLAEADKRGVQVGNTPDVLTDATADIAVALLLSVARRLPEASQDVRDGRWRTWEPLGWVGLDLQERTLGIVGMGRIGAAVARRLHGGWGMRVMYTARNRKPQIDEAYRAEYVSLETLLRHSDFVSVHAALNAETRHLIGSQELGLMKGTAVLVNTARGEVIDQAALLDALREKRIFGAGLDVCTPEPLRADDPLLSLSNCVVLPHIGSATTAARNAMSERAALNIIAGLRGEPLPYPVHGGR